MKINKIGFSLESKIAIFQFLAQLSEFSFWVAGWAFASKFKSFRDFLEICYKAGIHLFKVNIRNTRPRYEICLKLAIKTLEYDLRQRRFC